MDHMTIAKVTGSGQVSLPAAVRRRWGVSQVCIADEGDRLVVRPLPDDPIQAACGSLVGRGGASERLRAAERRATARSERRRFAR